MAALYYAPCIVYAGNPFYLPPGIKVTERRSQDVFRRPIPRTDSAVIGSIQANQGIAISLKIDELCTPATQAKALLWIEQIWANLRGKIFALFIFSDRAYTQCALLDFTSSISTAPFHVLDCSLEIYSANHAADTTQKLTFATSYAVDYPFASMVGRPSGDDVGSGGTTPVAERARQTFGHIFPGIIAVTPTGGDHKYIVGGTAGSQWRLKSLKVVNAMPLGSTGTTTLRASNAAVGGSPTGNVDATVLINASEGTQVAGTVLYTAGDAIYVFCTATGDHADVQYSIQLEAES